MKSPRDVQIWVNSRLKNQKQRWLDGHGTWPLVVSLDRPKQQAAFDHALRVKSWSASWGVWRQQRAASGEAKPVLVTSTVVWPSLGPQDFPERLVFETPEVVADFCSEGSEWRRASRRRALMIERWPATASAGLGVHYKALSTYSDGDFDRLLALLDWFVANPKSELYVRQLPVPGIDTKWVDNHRRRLVADLLRRIRAMVAPLEPLEDTDTEPPIEADEADDDSGGGFYEVCGLRRASPRVRMIVLCPHLRTTTGGLRDIEAPVEELATLSLSPRAIIVVENKDTGLCLPDISGVVAVIKLGNAVSLVQRLTWLRDLPVVYWGDVDTHGFAILAHARRTLGNVRSILMDVQTVKLHLDRLVDEPTQTRRLDRNLLSAGELEVYDGLLDGNWGHSVRLEQERLTWPTALEQVLLALQNNEA